MGQVVNLVSLCIQALKKEIVQEDYITPVVYELPHELFDMLVAHLPPLALEKLETEMPFKNWDGYESKDDCCFGSGRKRQRSGNFNAAWRTLFKLRWPQLTEPAQSVDWRQMYWETHLQNCLDEAAAIASLPAFKECINDIKLPETMLIYIGCEGNIKYLELSYHCQQFGYYTRCLRLQSVFCIAETCHLLRNCTLQSLELQWIRSKEHVDGICKLLNQNSETLTSVAFNHCKLPPSSLDAVCGSILKKGLQTHGIQHFSVNTSSFVETNPVQLPAKFVSFLSSGRSLSSLRLCDNHIGPNYAKIVFSVLLDASSSLSILDLSENNISGGLSNFNQRTLGGPQHPSAATKLLQSLRVLNLRDNNLNKDDASNLRCALIHMPNLEILNIGDNPIENDGIRSLIPYLVEASERCSPFAELNVENCDLSCDGVSQLLHTLSSLKRPLKSLSIANNYLRSLVTADLVKFLRTSVQVVNIEGIGLGSLGFRELHEGLTQELSLVDINISKNRGGIETANLLSKLISKAPELVAVNAAYNFMPVESLVIISSALRVAKGNVQRLDLSGNTWEYQPDHNTMLAEFQHNGKPILILPTSSLAVPYDDDP